MLLSTALLAEWRNVLLSSHVRTLHGLSEREVALLRTAIAAYAIVREPERRDGAPGVNDAHVRPPVENDPNCVTITDDKLLLEHRPPTSRVVTPPQFVQLRAEIVRLDSVGSGNVHFATAIADKPSGGLVEKR